MEATTNSERSIRIQAGDRVIEVEGREPFSADVLKVSKDGTRIRVQFWNRWGELQTMWTYAISWRKK